MTETRPSRGSGGLGSIPFAGNRGGSTVAAEEATWDSQWVSKHVTHESVSLCCHLAWMLTGGA